MENTAFTPFGFNTDVSSTPFISDNTGARNNNYTGAAQGTYGPYAPNTKYIRRHGITRLRTTWSTAPGGNIMPADAYARYRRLTARHARYGLPPPTPYNAENPRTRTDRINLRRGRYTRDTHIRTRPQRLIVYDPDDQGERAPIAQREAGWRNVQRAERRLRMRPTFNRRNYNYDVQQPNPLRFQLNAIHGADEYQPGAATRIAAATLQQDPRIRLGGTNGRTIRIDRRRQYPAPQRTPATYYNRRGLEIIAEARQRGGGRNYYRQGSLAWQPHTRQYTPQQRTSRSYIYV